MTAPLPTATPVDLRHQPVDPVLERVERSLQVRLDRDTMVRKRRTVGAHTDRDTWVRIERRPFEKIEGQGWNGAECAALLDGIEKPAWFGGVVWGDAAEAVMWRADETELLPGAPVNPGVASALPDEWWAAMNASLDALAAHHTTRVATPDTVTVTQARVTESIQAVFPSVLDTTIRNWAPAHADLTWANVTTPQFCLFDWEDWGMAPRGLDAAWLWGNSLAMPELAARLRRERRNDAESRDGKLMALFFCTRLWARMLTRMTPGWDSPSWRRSGLWPNCGPDEVWPGRRAVPHCSEINPVRRGTWMLQSDTACRRLHVPRGERYPRSLQQGATATLGGGLQ